MDYLYACGTQQGIEDYLASICLTTIIQLLAIYQQGDANYLEPFHDNPTFELMRLQLAFLPGKPKVVSKKSFVMV